MSAPSRRAPLTLALALALAHAATATPALRVDAERERGRWRAALQLPFGRKQARQEGNSLVQQSQAQSQAQFSLGRSAAVAGAIAGMSLASEAAQYANTALLIAYLRRRTGLDVPGLVTLAVDLASQMGLRAYVLYGALIVSFQVFPFQLSAFISVLFSGVLFGVWRGTLLVTLACACSSAISRLLAKAVQRRWPAVQLSACGERMAVLEARLSKAHFGTAMLAVALLRLSPVFPFVPTNYLLGLTSIDGRAVFWGTLLGCLLPQAALVSAGVVGASALGGSISVSPTFAAMGAAATVTGLWLLGKLSSQALDAPLPSASPAAPARLK